MSSESHPVLIIEDEDFIRENFQLFLELEGYAVLTARNGQEGLDQLRKMTSPPCLILLDLRMPVMSGEEFLKAKAAEESFASIPVCVLSGAANEPDLTGVADFVPKPVDFTRLGNLIRTYCGPSATD